MKKMNLKLKGFLLAVTISVIGFFSFSFSENYFEISKNLDIFSTLFRELNMNYVDETAPGALTKTAIDAMLTSLDPYTNYISESEIEDFKIMTTGEYGGIGAFIRNEGEDILISEPYENFPAQKADLRAGDILLEIDGKIVKGKRSDQISDILKGQPGTELKLKIKRPGTEAILEKTIKREVIKIENVPYYGMIDEKIGYIKLTSFTETASKEVKDAFVDLKNNKGMEALVFDLRGNGGGLLREAVNIVNFFVDKGQDVVATKGKIPESNKTLKALNAPLDLNIPLVVLVDQGSASASEIVAGSLQDLDRAVIIGQKTFGKGLVQQTRPLSYNAQLKVTVAKYYTPSGRCIQKIDYSRKDSTGKAIQIADSLITEFKTKNGRTVYDGEGITPDVLVKEISFSPISIALVTKNHLFDYATKFRIENEKIDAADKFELSDNHYNDFSKFLQGKDYDYTTRSEQNLEELKKVAIDEKYYDEIEKEYDALKKRIYHNKSEDLINFKSEIKELLENEIVSRYFFQKGRILNSFRYDMEMAKAKEVLKNKELSASILSAPKKPDAKK